ncbi:MAG TPA: hypothetical protein VK579_12950 [Terriglobales bacterium]|jgi:hypothetical protein|nr:hypothetical protein [Terriglobales bacterium]
MQDPDTPPVVEEGEASVGAGAVRPIVVEPPAVIVNNKAASTPLPWTIATERP